MILYLDTMEAMLYDVAVIGGGPAGMMAAGRAAQCGARVVLLEKNLSLGAKLLITGGGRSNVTNAEFDRNVFLGKFRNASKFLFSPLATFGVQDTLDFFHSHGMPTKIEAEKRVFPVSDSAQSVWDALVRYMRQGSVTVLAGMEVTGIDAADGQISGIRLKNGDTVNASAYILATGGKSRPETGSTGDGFRWLHSIGHTTIEPRPSLVPLRVRELWAHSLSGVSFPEAKLTVFQNDKEQGNKKVQAFPSRRGKILFTHFGLSGPLVLNMSRDISEFLQYGEVTVSLDLISHMNIGEIDKQIQSLFAPNKNKQIKNSLEGFVAPLLVPVLLRLASIDPEKPVHSVSRAERIALVRLLKDLRMTVIGLLGEDKAIVTSGGVALEEVDFKHMRSRLYPNLYLVGDVLNIDRPSGGYSLQLCWTTGYVAGTAAAKK
ncbi:MAG: aminoacetone oxidase family FAD-binding enzyme [Candidatus Moraniibacteriota bacterium]